MTKGNVRHRTPGNMDTKGVNWSVGWAKSISTSGHHVTAKVLQTTEGEFHALHTCDRIAGLMGPRARDLVHHGWLHPYSSGSRHRHGSYQSHQRPTVAMT